MTTPSQHIGIFTVDRDLVIRSWDATMEQLTGIVAASAKDRRLDDLVPDLAARGLLERLREPLASGAAQVLAPSLHHYLIPCAPLEPDTGFERMQQRVVMGALRDQQQIVGLVIAVEDVTARMAIEKRLAHQLGDEAPEIRMAAVARLAEVEPLSGLGPLAAALGDHDWRVRRLAVQALASRPDAALVDAVIAVLRDGHRDFSLLSSALQLLPATGVDLTAALVSLLGHEDAEVRLQAALALGTQRGPGAASALVAALDDADVNVRFHAIEALGRLASAEAVEPLLAIAESRDFFLAFPALDALVRIDDPTVAPRIASLLDDPLLAPAAAEALGHIGDEEAVAPLAAALVRPGAPVAVLAGALAAIHRRYVDELGGGQRIADLVRDAIAPDAAAPLIDVLATTSGDDLRNLVVVLGWLRGPAVQDAVARLIGAPDVRQEVIEALVRFGSSTVERLVEHVASGGGAAQRDAITALGQIGDRRAVLPLVAILDGDGDLRGAAAGALARIGDPRAFEALLRLIGDEDVTVRRAAIAALNSIGHPAMGARIRELLDDPRPAVRESAVQIAGYFGYAECAAGLLARCQDEHEQVRAAAVEHLPYLDHPGAPADSSPALLRLASVLATDTPRVRAAAAQALGQVTSARAGALLERALADPDAWVRYFAALSIGRRRDVAALGAIERLLTTDPARQVRIAAVEALGAIGGEAAVRLLAPLAATAEDDIATTAIRVLGRTGAAAAADSLAAAMRALDSRRRAAAAEALAIWGRGEAVELLRWAASADADPHVAAAALQALTTLSARPAPIGARAVAAIVACTADRSRRAEAVAALARVPPAAIEAVAAGLGDRDPSVRRAVVDALGRMTHPTASAWLRRALDDTDALVRRQAIATLARLGTRGIARRLATLATSDPSPAVRQAAGAAARRYGAPADGAMSHDGQG